MPEYEKANRQDMVDNLKEEIKISEYLPEQLTEAEITQLVQEAIEQAGANSPKDMVCYGQLMPKVKGKADGKLVNKMLKIY